MLARVDRVLKVEVRQLICDFIINEKQLAYREIYKEMKAKGLPPGWNIWVDHHMKTVIPMVAAILLGLLLWPNSEKLICYNDE